MHLNFTSEEPGPALPEMAEQGDECPIVLSYFPGSRKKKGGTLWKGGANSSCLSGVRRSITEERGHRSGDPFPWRENDNWLNLLFGPSPASPCSGPPPGPTCGLCPPGAAATYGRCRLCPTPPARDRCYPLHRNHSIADRAQRPVQGGDKLLLDLLQPLSLAKNNSKMLGHALQLFWHGYLLSFAKEETVYSVKFLHLQ